MAEVYIGGRLKNLIDTDGVVAEASDIALGEKKLDSLIESLQTQSEETKTSLAGFETSIEELQTKIEAAAIVKAKEYLYADFNEGLSLVPGIYRITGSHESSHTKNNPEGSDEFGVLIVDDLTTNSNTLIRQIWQCSDRFYFRYVTSIDGSSVKEATDWKVIKEIDEEKFSTKEEVKTLNEALTQQIESGRGVKKFSNDAEMQVALANNELELGDVVSCFTGSTEEYNEDYNVYIVTLDTSNNKFLKLVSGGGTGTVVLPEFEIVDIYLNGTRITDFSKDIDCNKGDKLSISYTLTSIGNEDIVSTISYRLGSLSGTVAKIEPDGDINTWDFIIPEVESSVYKLTLYGTVFKNQSNKEILTLRIGSLEIDSSFDENTIFKVGSAITVPLTVDLADATMKVKANLFFDDQLILEPTVNKGSNLLLIDGNYITAGIHTIKVYIESSDGKKSNEKTFNIVAAENGKIYAIPNQYNYTTSEGERFSLLLRTVKLLEGEEKEDELNFITTATVYDSEGNSLEDKTKVYGLSFGVNLIQMNNLTFEENDNPFSIYTIVYNGTDGWNWNGQFLVKEEEKITPSLATEIIYNSTVYIWTGEHFVSKENSTLLTDGTLESPITVIYNETDYKWNGTSLYKDDEENSVELIKTTTISFMDVNYIWDGYNFKNGEDILNISENKPYTKYTVKFSAEIPDSIYEKGETEIEIHVFENNYNLEPLVNENLICWFDASGKSNNSNDYNIWVDKHPIITDGDSPVKATLHDFNWTTNGWEDVTKDGKDIGTALSLNSGAYVELDITPFLTEVNDSMTISIDFETRDILDSTAKVVSCLYEYEGEEESNYYLRDNFAEYIEAGSGTEEFVKMTLNATEIDTKTVSYESNNYIWNGTTLTNSSNSEDIVIPEENITDVIYNAYTYRYINGEFVNISIQYDIVDSSGEPLYLHQNNIINYFRYAGGYCWVDGVDYSRNNPYLGKNRKTGESPYTTTLTTNNRSLNYNAGEPDLTYNNPNDKTPGAPYNNYSADSEIQLKKYTGIVKNTVTKEVGFYVDTENAVLSHNGSSSKIDEKFHLNFSQDTRTKIDLIIQRNVSEPYYFASLIGYTNGVLSLMEELNTNDKFIQAEGKQRTFKIYFGGKAKYNLSDDKNTVRSIDIVDKGDCKIYDFKIYKKALTPEEILRNYAASIVDPEKKKKTMDNNGIDGTGSFKSNMIADLPQITFIGENTDGTTASSTMNKFIMQLVSDTGTSIGELKEIKEPAYVQFEDPSTNKKWVIKDETTGTENDIIPVRLQFQGTSSMVYPIKNFKFKCYTGFAKNNKGKYKYGDEATDANGKPYDKIKFDLGNGIKEQTFCLKVDYMDSSHCNNTGTANFISNYNIYATGKTPASELDSRIRTTIYGFPVLIYYQLDKNDQERKFIGVGNLNLDKSCTTSFGLKNKVADPKDVSLNFGSIQYIDDEHTKDILVRALYDGDTSMLVAEETPSFEFVLNGEYVIGTTMYLNEVPTAVLYDGIYYTLYNILSFNEDEEKCTKTNEYELAVKNPKTGNIVGTLTKLGILRSLEGEKVSYVQCSEYKANSGSGGAGGFGNYNIESIASDIELRQPDDGDTEEINYAAYKAVVGEKNAIPYREFKNPHYYHIQRMIKWVMNSEKDDFKNNLDLHFNRNYLMDYFLTIMLIGGVDSLGKNLMVGTWGPENRLYETHENANDEFKFKYGDKWITPTLNKFDENGVVDPDEGAAKQGQYVYATDENGLFLYYDESRFDRWEKKFKNSNDKVFTEEMVTTVPGECIWYPTFYDIDTICGLDNSGHLIFDVDIEMGDTFDDGSSIFNTADSHLWRRVRDYLGEENENGVSVLSERWNYLRDTHRTDKDEADDTLFSEKNLIQRFYYENQVSKIPERYYNEDAFKKYIYEGPNARKGSGAYLYCIHGSRYEQLKRWYSQRIKYLDSLFSRGFGDQRAIIRFNHPGYDENFGDSPDYYNDLISLAENKPDVYKYNTEKNILTDASNRQIIPIAFDFKTYQPGYVGLRWFNGGVINKKRVKRGEISTLKGNVKSKGDFEVFIYGGDNIKEIGDMYKFTPCQITFAGELAKLNKLILGMDGYTNEKLTDVSLGSKEYLTEVNLTGLQAVTSINVSACKNLKTLLMKGSKISSIELPEGGALETIKYSSYTNSINLNNFNNLTTIEVDGWKNITSFVIKNCPKITGFVSSDGSINYQTKAWDLLQQTNNSDNLTTIDVTSYGECDPKILLDGSEYLFLDKFYSNFNSKLVKGELIYNGTSVPQNYTKFRKSYPDLHISYKKISDASGMFEDYKNISLIGTVECATDKKVGGKIQYVKQKYWVDSTDTIYPDGRNAQEKWHNDSVYEKYNCSSTYTSGVNFYISDGVYYRLVETYDNEDLDLMRAEIKQNVQSFNKFTNIHAMFKNIGILDYLDPDTFNNIDLSEVHLTEGGADEVFYGCKNLRYFEIPSDIVKCELRTRYETKEGVVRTENDYETEELFQAAIDNGDISLKEYYYDIVNNKEAKDEDGDIYTTVTANRGLRRIGANMFYNCKKARIFLRKLSTANKLYIDNSAFKYISYVPNEETQDKTATVERPVLMFEYNATDLLNITNDAISTINGITYNNIPVDGVEGLYYEVNNNGQKVWNISNNYIDLKDSAWLREVYFEVSELKINDNTLDENFSISYAERKDGSRIIFKVVPTNDTVKEFNYETDYSNPLNIYSITLGAFSDEKMLTQITTLQIPIPKVDNLDIGRNTFDIEKFALPLFVEGKMFNFDTIGTVTEYQKMVLEKIFIIDSEEIPDNYFYNFNKLKYVGISSSLKKIGNFAFFNCTEMINFLFNVKDNADTKHESKINENHLTLIGSSAFRNCTKLGSFLIPDNVNELGESIFEGCSSLVKIRFSANISSVPDKTFKDCIGLLSTGLINFSENITAFGKESFYNCKSIILVDDGGQICFDKNEPYNLNRQGFKYFTNITSIGDEAFYNIGGLVPSNEKSIPKLRLPSTLIYIGNNAFYQQNRTAADSYKTEIIWDKDTDYSNLYIGSGAFYNLYILSTEFTGKIEEGLPGFIILPKVRYIGANAFFIGNATKSTGFELCLTKNTEAEIGRNWVNVTKKIIFSYEQMEDIETAYPQEVSEDLYNSTKMKSRFILSFDGEKRYAYLYRVTEKTENKYNIFIPETVITTNNNIYIIREILSDAFSTDPAIITNLIFDKKSKLEKIESGVLPAGEKTSSLSSIRLQSSNNIDDYSKNTIPETLFIEGGNNLKVTNWFVNSENINEDGFIILGKYIIGRKETEDEVVNGYTLDLTVDSLKDCSVIYDDAFAYGNCNKVKFSNNIKYIYKNAFTNSKLEYITEGEEDFLLPNEIEEIRESAFNNCKFKKLFIPASLKTLGRSAFKEYDDNATPGNLKHLEFGDGCNLKDRSGFSFQLEIPVTSTKSVNNSLETLIIPSSMGDNIMNVINFSDLAQVKNLYIGNIARDETTGMAIKVQNPYLYLAEDGSMTFEEQLDEGGVPRYAYETATGKQIYGLKFYREMFNDRFNTTEAESYYPMTDYTDEDTGEIKYGYTSDIDITTIRAYEGIDDLEELSKEDLLAILAGITKDGRMVKLRLTNKQIALISAERGTFENGLRNVLFDIVEL